MKRLLAIATGRGGSVAAPAAGRLRPRLRRPGPRVLIALAVLAVLAGGGWLWLRDSSLVAVRKVQVVGLSGADADRARAALILAARNQTTLHVRVDALRRAAAPFPLVKEVRAQAHPPHGLTIDVVEQIPVATIAADGRALPVAADGTILPGTAGVPLPRIAARTPGTAGSRVTEAAALRAINLMAAAPAPLRDRVARVAFSGAHGLVAVLRRGPALYFGGASRLEAKWMAAASVLADAGSGGARYVDLRVPERPAAGGLPAAPAAPAAPSSTGPAATRTPPAATPQPAPPAAAPTGTG